MGTWTVFILAFLELLSLLNTVYSMRFLFVYMYIDLFMHNKSCLLVLYKHVRVQCSNSLWSLNSFIIVESSRLEFNASYILAIENSFKKILYAILDNSFYKSVHCPFSSFWNQIHTDQEKGNFYHCCVILVRLNKGLPGKHIGPQQRPVIYVLSSI